LSVFYKSLKSETESTCLGSRRDAVLELASCCPDNSRTLNQSNSRLVALQHAITTPYDSFTLNTFYASASCRRKYGASAHSLSLFLRDVIASNVRSSGSNFDSFCIHSKYIQGLTIQRLYHFRSVPLQSALTVDPIFSTPGNSQYTIWHHSTSNVDLAAACSSNFNWRLRRMTSVILFVLANASPLSEMMGSMRTASARQNVKRSRNKAV